MMAQLIKLYLRDKENTSDAAVKRAYALAKELHSFRYTQEYGQARMEWKAALTFACINLKKLAKVRWKQCNALAFFLIPCLFPSIPIHFHNKSGSLLAQRAALSTV